MTQPTQETSEPPRLAEAIWPLLSAGAGDAGSPLDAPARWQDEVILREIPPGARVLDLGCGGGELLSRLAGERGARVQGVEMDPDGVLACIGRGVPVFQMDLDAEGEMGLMGFPDRAYDYVVLENTLQTLRRPRAVLRDMRRIGKRGIVGFPNIAHWKARFRLAGEGQMPVARTVGWHWSDTPDIHCLSLRDFLDEALALQLRLLRTTVRADGLVRDFEPGDNLRAEEILCVFEG